MDYPDPHKPVLVLNSSYEPINITNWKRAIVLLLKNKAHMLSKRVIRLVEYIALPLKRMRITHPTRNMIYQRDDHKCQYCGSTRHLTIDHVLPRSKGGEDTWENMVVACSTCNTKKGDRYLEQTGMRLARKPRAPVNNMFLTIEKSKIPEWSDYVYGIC